MPLHRPTLRTALALLATAFAGLAIASTAATASTSETDVPDRIQVGDGYKQFLAAHAVGVQIYACTVTADGQKWQLVGPRANLYGDNGKLIGTHSAGPTWQATDGSWVKARRVDGVTVDPSAIQWLLLEKTTASAGSDGDRFAGTRYIQRVLTAGGLEPAAGECTAETIGSQREIPYTADYRFWKPLSA